MKINKNLKKEQIFYTNHFNNFQKKLNKKIMNKNNLICNWLMKNNKFSFNLNK